MPASTEGVLASAERFSTKTSEPAGTAPARPVTWASPLASGSTRKTRERSRSFDWRMRRVVKVAEAG